MANDSLVTDPALLSVLDAAARAREQSLAILDILEQYHGQAAPEDSTEQTLTLSKQQKILNTYLAQLRGLNRKAVFSVRRTKQETSEARQEIDSLHLQLQNLYYEQRHLQEEIKACKGYEYKTLDMTKPEEFIAAHPELSESNEHDLMVARIEDEHAARQTLEEQRQVLQKRKEALTKETNAKKEELGKLDADIERWLSGEANIRKIFDNRDKKRAEMETE